MTKSLIFTVCVLWASALAFANPEVPGGAQKKPVAIINATIHPVSGPAITGGTILFDKGKIVALGKDATPPADAEVIDAAGKHVYPGLFDALTDLGLVEINSIRATIDGQEVGQLNPNVRALVAVNPDSEIIPVTRASGVLLALTAPYGGLMSGRSAVIQLDGWTWEDLALGGDTALHIQWPQYSSGARGRRGGAPAEEGGASRSEQAIQQLHQALADARAYAATRKANPNFPHDARWESLQDVLAGKLPVIVHADDLRQITSAVAFCRQEKLKPIIAGGYDARECLPLLKQQDVPVIVAGTYRLPRRRGDAYDAAYALPAALQAAGIRYCIGSQGRFGATNVRNLPNHAAAAIGFGLSADEALKAITLYPAQILGVAGRVGSLEVGKDATLFIADGDALDTTTHVTAGWIQGRKIELNDRHKRLYRKYEQKYLP